VKLLTGHGIYKEEEIRARYAIYVEKYIQEILIESRTMTDMVRKDILPAVSGALSDLLGKVLLQNSCGIGTGYEKSRAAEIAAGVLP
jgi:glutamine synthetase